MKFTEKELKILNLYCKILTKMGIPESSYSFYSSHGYSEYNDDNFRVNHTDESHIPVFPELIDIANKIYEDYDLVQYTDEEAKWQEIKISIVPSEKVIKIYNIVSILDSEYSVLDISYSDMTNEEKEGFDLMKEESNGENDGIDFDGGGDSGYVSSQTWSNNDVNGKIEDLCYKLLNRIQPGWEIDEGSSGTFELNYDKNSIKLNFGLHVENKLDPELIETISFG